jgi:phosphoribosylanthranilate isomerase
VFAGASLTKVSEIGMSVGLDSLQVYPLSTTKGIGAAAGADLPKQNRLYFAFPMEKFVSNDHAITMDVTRNAENSFVAILLDSGGTNQPGGTGLTFDWNKAAPGVARLSRTEKVVIAGGLTPRNVGEAIEILQPWGVDVVSGVEARPGKKDPEKVRAFVKAVREMDRKTG